MKIQMVLGNGFTIDFLNYINFSEKIDVSNLFKFGASVKWPADGNNGFLSYRYCPNLWTLGARPFLDKESTINLIDDIITCANVFASAGLDDRKKRRPTPDQRNTYIFAYKELLQYLKYLFVHYNNCVEQIPDNIIEWPWARYFKKLNDDPSIEEISIITLNYDIWLERLLRKLEIGFSFPTFESTRKSKIKIYKPHGSISFKHKSKLEHKEAFAIKYDYELLDGNVDDFTVSYSELDENYLITALIPPAGDSNRFNHSWAKKIREDVITNCKEFHSKTSSSDELIICGISYWHVDRNELDEIFTTLPENICVKVINPNMDRTLNAVITSLFNKYILYTDSNNLLGGS